MSDDMREARERARKRAAARQQAEHLKERQEKLEKIKKEAAEKAKLFEAEKQAALKRIRDEQIAKNGRPRKVLVSGDPRGQLAKLFATVEAQAAKVGAFEALFCVGEFIPSSVEASAEGLSEYLRGEKKVPLETFFIDRSAALLQAYPQGHQLSENLHFLGGYGVKECCGFRVAFLSGHFDPEKYETPGVDFVGGAFTANAVNELKKTVAADKKKRGIDILLTCGWPAGIDQKIEAANLKPPALDDGSTWQAASASALAELCLNLEPRYHIFGTADLFYQRPPFQVPRRGLVSRCISLGKVGSTGKLHKWLHALSLSPMEWMRPEDLKQLPEGTTPCPFVQKRPASEPASGEPEAKRRASSETAQLSERAVQTLLGGNVISYLQLSSQVQSGVVVCGNATPKDVEEPAKPKAVPEKRVFLTDLQAEDAVTRLKKTQAACGRKLAVDELEPQKPTEQEEEEEEDMSPEAVAAREAAKLWLSRPPEKGIVRFTFREYGALGIRLSRDVPPWILEVRDGTLASKKAPRVPVGGIVLAINGIELSSKDNSLAIKALAKRPVALDVEWPFDQPFPSVNNA